MEYVFLIVGFVLLIKGADFFVDGASSIATRLKVPTLIIGLTVVSLGTSMPEAAISISASVSGNNAISLGNVIGSNIFNLLMVVGISSIILPIVTDKDVLKRDMPLNIAVTVLLFVTLIDGRLDRIDSAIFLVIFVAYMFILIRSARKNRTEESGQKALSWTKSIIFAVIGIVAIILGGQLVVNNAKIIAASLGMSQSLIGLTVVALGTSLPELVTSVVAAKKGESGIALGNAVGSSIFNVLFILGMAGVIRPMSADTEFFIDTAVLIAVSVMVLIFAFTKRKTSRLEGVVCALVYVAYTAYIIMRAFNVWIF